MWQPGKEEAVYEVYKEVRNLAKWVVCNVNGDEMGLAARRLTENFHETKKIFRKKVKRMWKEASGKEKRK